MPLTQAVERQLIHGRKILCEGYLRNDGLWDIDGYLHDAKTYTLEHRLRNRVLAGEPTHDMKARLTIDGHRVIRAVEVAMDAFAFPACPGSLPNYQRLVGLDIGTGFTKQLHQLVGRAHGCTHLSWLIQCMARVAIQTLTKQIASGQVAQLNALFGRPGESSRPALIDSCHAYDASGEVVKTLFPEHHRESD